MKKVVLTTLTVLMIAVLAYGQESNKIWETIYLMPKQGHQEELNKALSDHNKMYHATEPHTAFVHYISVGQMAGYYSWLMGPMKFADLDNCPKGEHDKEWAENVIPHVKKFGDLEYWVNSDTLSYWPENGGMSDKFHCMYWDVKNGKTYQFKKLLEKVVKVFKANKYEHSWAIYFTEFDTDNGRDVLAVMNFNSWGYFDGGSPFVKDYEAMYGENSFKEFMDEFYALTYKGTDEVREVMKVLSGTEMKKEE